MNYLPARESSGFGVMRYALVQIRMKKTAQTF